MFRYGSNNIYHSIWLIIVGVYRQKDAISKIFLLLMKFYRPIKEAYINNWKVVSCGFTVAHYCTVTLQKLYKNSEFCPCEEEEEEEEEGHMAESVIQTTDAGPSL